MREEGETIPKIASKSTLFVGVTEPLRRRIKKESNREAVVKDLAGNMVVTKYPNIAEEVFEGMGVEIFAAPGSTEAVQYIYDDCNGILDITATRATVRANKIKIIECVLDPVPVQLINQQGLSSRQERILATFKGALL